MYWIKAEQLTAKPQTAEPLATDLMIADQWLIATDCWATHFALEQHMNTYKSLRGWFNVYSYQKIMENFSN